MCKYCGWLRKCSELPEGLELREVGVHLGRRLSARGVLEDHLYTVDGHFLDILFDNDSRRNETKITCRCILPDRLINMAEGASRKSTPYR